MLIIILSLGVVFEFANHFHLTYLFMSAKLESLVSTQVWIIKAISIAGAMFFITSIVGFGIIGYRIASWISAGLTIIVSYVSYNLMPEAMLKAEIMQIGTFEFSVVLPIAVAFTTHELSKFLNLKTISKLSQRDLLDIEEEEREIEKLKRKNELQEQKKSLTPTLPPSNQQTHQEPPKSDPYQEAFDKFGLNGTPKPHTNGNGKYHNQTETVVNPTVTVGKNKIGFEIPEFPTVTVEKEEKHAYGNRNNGFDIVCLNCGTNATKRSPKAKFCCEECKSQYHEKESEVKLE